MSSDSFVGEGLNPTPYREMKERAERAEAERDALRAENERLRGLLQGIPSFIFEPRWYGNQEWVKRIDATLAGEKT